MRYNAGVNSSFFGTRATTARQYGDVAGIYDALMHNVPHHLWLDRIERALLARDKTVHSVLDVACGTGLAAQLLDFRGYRPVVGFDISPAMVAIAKTKAQAHGWAIEYLVQDAAELNLLDDTGGRRRFDFAISMFDSMNYILQPERLQLALRRVGEHLVPGGVFAFDMNAIYAFEKEMFTQDGEYSGISHAWVSEYDPATRLCRVEMIFKVRDEETGEIRVFEELHLQRGYEVEEVRRWLGEAGFVKIEAFGNYGMRAPSRRSDRLLFVAEMP